MSVFCTVLSDYLRLCLLFGCISLSVMWVLIVGVRWNWLRLWLTSFYLVLSRFLNTKSQVLRKRAGWTLDCWPLLMLRYTADDLWAFRRDDVTPPRRARKTIFKHRLWQPRGQREYQARRLRRSEFSHSTLIDRTTTGIRVDLLNVRSVAIETLHCYIGHHYISLSWRVRIDRVVASSQWWLVVEALCAAWLLDCR